MTETMRMIDEVGPLTEEQLEACTQAARAALKEPTSRPIMMAYEMVRGVLKGTKTQTRRGARNLKRCPFGSVGEQLWVRETWAVWPPESKAQSDVVYRADISDLREESVVALAKGGKQHTPWISSMFMPRWASRLQLEITEIRLEHVQEISEADALCEGVDGISPIESYAKLWDELNARRPGNWAWKDNPWVWAISFRRLQP